MHSTQADVNGPDIYPVFWLLKYLPRYQIIEGCMYRRLVLLSFPLCVINVLTAHSALLTEHKLASATGHEATTVPGGIVLLPGYHYQAERGIDTWVGKIWKKGFSIEHAIGDEAAMAVDPEMKSQYSHFEEEHGANQTMWWALSTSGRCGVGPRPSEGPWPKVLCVSFSCKANFVAQVRSQHDIDDAMKMLRTFQCDRLYK
jgi:hypothetical protein